MSNMFPILAHENRLRTTQEPLKKGSKSPNHMSARALAADPSPFTACSMAPILTYTTRHTQLANLIQHTIITVESSHFRWTTTNKPSPYHSVTPLTFRRSQTFSMGPRTHQKRASAHAAFHLRRWTVFFLASKVQRQCREHLQAVARPLSATLLLLSRRELPSTAWASSNIWHFTARSWSTQLQNYVELATARPERGLRHPTTDYALPLRRARNIKLRFHWGVSEITSLQDTLERTHFQLQGCHCSIHGLKLIWSLNYICSLGFPLHCLFFWRSCGVRGTPIERSHVQHHRILETTRNFLDYAFCVTGGLQLQHEDALLTRFTSQKVDFRMLLSSMLFPLVIFTSDLAPTTLCRCTMRFWHGAIDGSQLTGMDNLPTQTFLEHRYFRETLQQACTSSLLPPALLCATPLHPNRRQISQTAWASSKFWHFTTRSWTSLLQNYAELTAARLALDLRHLTTGYALPLERSRNTKPRLSLGVSEIISLQDTVPVVTRIPQGWSPDSQFTTHSSPTCSSSMHSESFVCDFLPTPCARPRWQEVNLRHHGPLYICTIPQVCLRLQEIKLRRREPSISSSTSPANFGWQENKLRQPDPLCFCELFKITASSDWKPASKLMPPLQGHEPMVHPPVRLTVGCSLLELGFLLSHTHTQLALALTVALTTTTPLQSDSTPSPRAIAQQNHQAQKAASCHGFHHPQTKLNCIIRRPKLNLTSSPPNHHPHNSNSPHIISKKNHRPANFFSPLPKHRRPFWTRATETLFAAATILPPLACNNMVQFTKDRGEKPRHSNLCV